MTNIEEKKDELKRAMECVQAEYAILDKAGEILAGAKLTLDDISAVRALINSVGVGAGATGKSTGKDSSGRIYQRRRGARKSIVLAVKDEAKALEALARELSWSKAATIAVVKPMLKAGVIKIFGDDKIALTVKGQRQAKWFLQHPERFNFKGRTKEPKDGEVTTSHAVAA